MSVQAMAWVLERSTTRCTDRLVLLSLANHAGTSPVDGAWECYPSVETITLEAGLCRSRTTQDSLARLEAAGHIERVINGAPDSRIRGDRRPNLYRILVEPSERSAPTARSRAYERRDEMRRKSTSRRPDGVTRERVPSEPRGDAGRRDGVTREAARGDARPRHGVTRDVTQTIIEPSDEPSGEPKHTAVVLSSAEPVPDEQVCVSPPAGGFSAFFRAWPRGADRAGAHRAWRHLRSQGVSEADLIAGGRAWVAYWRDSGIAERYIPHLATWLRRGDWQIDPPAPGRTKDQERTDHIRGVMSRFLAKDYAGTAS